MHAKITNYLCMTFVLLLTVAPVAAQQTPFIKLTADHLKLGDVLQEFQKQSHIRLVFANSLVDSFTVFTQIADPPYKALKKILLGTPFDFIQENYDFWVIVPRAKTRNLPSDLSGKIIDERSLESISGANIYLEKIKLASTTNSLGYFELNKIPPGAVHLIIHRIGYEKKTVTIPLPGNSRRYLNIKLKPLPLNMPEVLIEDRFAKKHFDVAVTQQTLSKQQLQIAPVANDGDIFEIVHQLPGVTRRDLQDVFPHIEGGSATEVQVELDGVPIYVPTYGENRRSIFSSNLIDSFTLYRTGYGVEHGEALSGIVALQTKTSGPETNLNLSITGVGLNVTRQFKKLTWTSAWRSGKENNNFDVNNFLGHDFFNKFHLQLSPRKSLSLLSLVSYGAFAQSNSQKTDNLFSDNLGLAYRFNSANGTKQSLLIYRSDLQGKQHETGFKWHWQNQLGRHLATTAGLDAFHLDSRGTVTLDSLVVFKYIRETFIDIDPFSTNVFQQKATLISPFAGLNFRQKFLHGQAGVRVPMELKSGVTKPEPRAQLTFLPVQTLNISVAGGRIYQFTDRSYASEAKSGDKSGTGEFLITTPVDEPSYADHFRGEALLSLTPGVSFSFSLFKKNYHFNNRAYLARINNLVWLIPLQYGSSRGAEFWLSKTTGRLQGWLSLTLNHERYQNNHGTEFRPYFNRKHIFNASLRYIAAKQWIFKWQYFKADGYPFRNWNNPDIKIDPLLSSWAFTQKFLVTPENTGTLNQMAFGVDFSFAGIARQNALSLVFLKTLEDRFDATSDKFKLWGSLNLSF